MPARGELELGIVAADLQLDSVVVESVSDPGGLATRSCHVVGAVDALRDAAWLWGRAVVVTLVDGRRVAGEVVEVGEATAVIVDAGGTRTAVSVTTVRADVESPTRSGPPVVGDPVDAVDDDGREVAGHLVAFHPRRLVLRVAGGAVRIIAPDTVAHLAVAGVPAEPTLRCEVESARPGRHLVRITYATPGIAWRATHKIAALAAGDGFAVDHVTLVTSYVITADGLRAPRRASVRLVLGLPDEPGPPITIWDGTASIGGGAVQITGAARRRVARLERVYRGAGIEGGENPRHPDWREASTRAVWRELSFERLAGDAHGPLQVAVAAADPGGGVRWVDGEIEPARVDHPSTVVRVALAPEPELVGFRRKRGRDLVGELLIDDLEFSVANRGGAPVRVVIEEPLRGVVRPTVVFERVGDRDGGGEVLDDRWRATVEVAAGAIVQGQVVLQYRFKRY